MRPIKFAVSAALLALIIAPANAQVLNGGFSTPVVTNPLGYDTYSSATVPPSFVWAVDTDTIDHIGSLWQGSSNAFGDQSVDLSGDTNGSISQTVALVSGQQYQLQFDLAGNPIGGPAIKQVQVFFGGVSQGIFNFNTTGRTVSDMGWVTQSIFVTAPSASVSLRFASLTTGVSGPALDNVRMSVVSGVAGPEPGSLALAFTGVLGVVAAASRRRK